MDAQIAKAFRKWCRENLARGEKPTGQHAAEFFLTLGAAERDSWAKVHDALTRAGLI